MIFYVSRVDEKKGIPSGAFAIVDQPDQLITTCADALADVPVRKALK